MRRASWSRLCRNWRRPQTRRIFEQGLRNIWNKPRATWNGWRRSSRVWTRTQRARNARAWRGWSRKAPRQSRSMKAQSSLLEKTLEEEKETDAELTALSKTINAEAAEQGEEEPAATSKSHRKSSGHRAA